MLSRAQVVVWASLTAYSNVCKSGDKSLLSVRMRSLSRDWESIFLDFKFAKLAIFLFNLL